MQKYGFKYYKMIQFVKTQQIFIKTGLDFLLLIEYTSYRGRK